MTSKIYSGRKKIKQSCGIYFHLQQETSTFPNNWQRCSYLSAPTPIIVIATLSHLSLYNVHCTCSYLSASTSHCHCLPPPIAVVTMRARSHLSQVQHSNSDLSQVCTIMECLSQVQYWATSLTSTILE